MSRQTIAKTATIILALFSASILNAEFAKKIPNEFKNGYKFISEFMHNDTKYAFVTFSYSYGNNVNPYGQSDEEQREIHGEFFAALKSKISFKYIPETKGLAQVDISEDSCMVTSDIVHSKHKVCYLNAWFNGQKPLDQKFAEEARSALKKINSKKHPHTGSDDMAAFGLIVAGIAVTSVVLFVCIKNRDSLFSAMSSAGSSAFTGASSLGQQMKNGLSSLCLSCKSCCKKDYERVDVQELGILPNSIQTPPPSYNIEAQDLGLIKHPDGQPAPVVFGQRQDYI